MKYAEFRVVKRAHHEACSLEKGNIPTAALKFPQKWMRSLYFIHFIHHVTVDLFLTAIYKKFA